MPSTVDIANRALAQAGTRGQIASFNEPSKEARAAALFFDSTRDVGLALAPWDFARAVQTLAVLNSAPGTPGAPATPVDGWNTAFPMPPWAYTYAQPDDCIYVRYVLPQYLGDILSPARFVKSSVQAVGGGRVQVINTNAPNAIGIYTVRVEDPNSWSPLFEEMIVFALAAKLSVPLSGDKQLASANISSANSLLIQARITDGNESFNQQIDILPDWIRARTGNPLPDEPPDPLAFVGLFQLG